MLWGSGFLKKLSKIHYRQYRYPLYIVFKTLVQIGKRVFHVVFHGVHRYAQLSGYFGVFLMLHSAFHEHPGTFARHLGHASVYLLFQFLAYEHTERMRVVGEYGCQEIGRVAVGD